jgi:hypothetical protein
MRFPALLALALSLAACASERASEVLPGEASATGIARQAINTVGTPVYAVVKGASCVATGVVAIPAATAFQVTGIPQDRQFADDTYNNVGRVCGGSYRLGAPPEGVPPSQ